MKMTGKTSSLWRKTTAQKVQIRHLIDTLRSLDDLTLAQLGLERCEIERFAYAEVAFTRSTLPGDRPAIA